VAASHRLFSHSFAACHAGDRRRDWGAAIRPPILMIMGPEPQSVHGPDPAGA
jgi:hypothetical protein